ncbi:MAG TPA: ATP-dependent helicase, partial [Actinomycetota bacterium]
MSAGTAAPVTTATASIRRALKDREPTSEQWAAITAPLGPVHVVAGAGSGKTAVMAARIVYLIEQIGVPPSAILALTFTNKAATELEERVRDALAVGGVVPAGQASPAGPSGTAAAGAEEEDGLLPAGSPPADQVAVHTYHAFAADLVKVHGVRVGVEPDADLLSEAQQYQILLGLLDGERFEHLHVRTAGATIRKTLELAAACADHLVEPSVVAEHARRLEAAADAGERMPDWQVQAARERVELTRLVQRYTEEKRRRSRIDFGDQVARAFELVDRYDDLAAELRTRYPHVLLDEYQDTNIAQRRLIQVLCPPGSSIMAVGDARQAIYAFRGATMYNLLSFGEHFKPPGSGTPAPLPLSTNFRSGRRILALANSVIDAIPVERRGGSPLVAQAGAGEGEVRAALLSDQLVEADFVAEQLTAAHERGLDDGSYPDWRDMAVLVRSKRLLGPLREALERRDVPVEVVGLGGLLDVPEVADLVATLQVLDDPTADAALLRLLTGPR